MLRCLLGLRGIFVELNSNILLIGSLLVGFVVSHCSVRVLVLLKMLLVLLGLGYIWYFDFEIVEFLHLLLLKKQIEILSLPG